MGNISESDGIRADDALLCPTCFRECDGLEADCGRVIPPEVRRSRIKAHNRMIRSWLESMEDEPTWRGNGLWRTPPHEYVLWHERNQRVDEAMNVALCRWSLQREHLDLIEITELEADPLVAYMAMIELEPGKPPPRVESFGLLNVSTVMSAPRPGPHSGVVLAVG